MKKILSIFLVLLFHNGFSQNSNKKRVLVIPPTQFEYTSEFGLDEMAEKNETTPSKVFLMYEKALLNAFSNFNDENFEFVPGEASVLKTYKKKIKYKYGKFDGKQHNAVDLKSFDEASFSKLLELHNTDFVIFITWYDIQKESFTRKGKHLKRATYAAHYLDYDIYNLFMQQVVGKGKVKAEATEPNDLEVTYKLLRVKELGSAYTNFVAKIIDQLNKPIEQ